MRRLGLAVGPYLFLAFTLLTPGCAGGAFGRFDGGGGGGADFSGGGGYDFSSAPGPDAGLPPFDLGSGGLPDLGVSADASSGPSHGCSSALDCVNGCQDPSTQPACIDACHAATTPSGWTLLDTLLACLYGQAPGGGGGGGAPDGGVCPNATSTDPCGPENTGSPACQQCLAQAQGTCMQDPASMRVTCTGGPCSTALADCANDLP
jgi:hypothetical protein